MKSGYLLGLALAVCLAACLSGAGSAQAREGDDYTMRKAQTAIETTGVQCTLLDARRESSQGFCASTGGCGVGSYSSSVKGNSTRISGPEAYVVEVACQQGLGFFLVTYPLPEGDKTPVPPVRTFTCLELGNADSKTNLHCALAANKDQTAGLRPLAARAKIDCPIRAGRGVGHSDDQAFFEIACQDGDGYILVTDRLLRPDQPVESIPCLAADPASGTECTLTDVAPTLQAMKQYVAGQAQACVPTATHALGATNDGELVFEVGCQSGGGYIVSYSKARKFDHLLACNDPAAGGQCSGAK
jgi:hypothetical protein